MSKGVLTAITIMALALACSEKPAPRPAAAQPKWMKEDFSRRTTAAPEVAKAAAAADPDLSNAKLTPEEVKAALAAAQGSAPPTSSLEVPKVEASTEWSDMEKKQLDFEKSLRGIVVASAHGMYHATGCPSLTVQVIDLQTGRVVRYDYIGERMTLADARSRALPPHSACAPPSYLRPRDE